MSYRGPRPAHDPVKPDLFDKSEAFFTQRLLGRYLVGAHRAAVGFDPPPLDWPVVVRAACDDWLGGLLLEAVERQGWAVPLPQMQQLRCQARQIRQTNVRMMRGLARITRAARQQGLDILLLKGAALNLTVYGR